MPEKKVIMPFAVCPNFDRTSYVKEQVEKYRCHFEKALTMVDQMADSHFQCLCLFAYIDALAAESSEYKREGMEPDIFANFVLSCNARYDYLDKVEPVTFYYHVEEHIEKLVKIPGFPAELEIDINSFGLDHALFKDIVKREFPGELIEYIVKVKGKAFAEKKMKEHRLVNLLYRMRSKLAHEMSSPGMDSIFDNDSNIKEPYYCDYSRTYREGNNIVSDDVIELRIPYIFIRNILEDCLNYYLDECIRTNRTPFSHNKMTRKHVLSWYDK